MTALNKQARQVQRYANFGVDMMEWVDGGYVKYSDYLALLDELEKTQKGEKQWREVVDAFCVDDAAWHKLTTSNNELISFLSQALCKQVDRIAELEARTVKLPEYRNSPDMHTKQFYEAIGFNQGLDVFIEALRAAGIGVKGE
ncbi:hypothetical protein [Citrobacter braakii]|uniref:hypothetical protein n=1 Tax=Citrobacter braakii TaxID=57706 RepID=UPI0028BE0407|nr:hypothetical protein [Citrobacter braakii]MDT7059478.1 hypothetical protein [Citrobacter braakii]